MSDGALSPYVVIVPRGETATFRALKAARPPGLVEVIWDQRVGERRQTRAAVGALRRLGERRRPPHDTWALGFLIASRHDGSVAPCKTVRATE